MSLCITWLNFDQPLNFDLFCGKGNGMGVTFILFITKGQYTPGSLAATALLATK